MALVAVLSSCLGVHQSFSRLHTRISLEFLAAIDYTLTTPIVVPTCEWNVNMYSFTF